MRGFKNTKGTFTAGDSLAKSMAGLINFSPNEKFMLTYLKSVDNGHETSLVNTKTTLVNA